VDDETTSTIIGSVMSHKYYFKNKL